MITGGRQVKGPQPAPVAKPEAAVPNRAPITQSDIDRAVAELHRQKLPARMAPGRENAEDLAAMSAAGGVQ